jgi:hypothetical protein
MLAGVAVQNLAACDGFRRAQHDDQVEDRSVTPSPPRGGALAKNP